MELQQELAKVIGDGITIGKLEKKVHVKALSPVHQAILTGALHAEIAVL